MFSSCSNKKITDKTELLKTKHPSWKPIMLVWVIKKIYVYTVQLNNFNNFTLIEDYYLEGTLQLDLQITNNFLQCMWHC